MLKQSPSRNQKSKGVKLKHILQICVLVAICFWLLYQVKHSQDKRREFDANGVKIIDNVKTDTKEILKFGRKDLPRVTEETTVGDKHVEDDEEKEFEEDEENKPEENENEIEKKEAEHEHENEQGEEELEDKDKEDDDDEDDVDENHTENDEKVFPGKEEHFESEENEEIQDVDTEDHGDKDAISDDQDRDVDNVEDTHEARDENYKADDASSEVAHHVLSIIPETKNATLGNKANDIFGEVEVDALEKNPEISKFNTEKTRNATVEGATGDKDANFIGNVFRNINETKLSSDESKFEASSNRNNTNVAHTIAVASEDRSVSNKSHDESSDVVSKDEGGGLIQNDPIDETDTRATEEDKGSRPDLDTLPRNQTESRNGEEVMAG